jgi:hypothetical protein
MNETQRPLFELLPLSKAMPRLVPDAPAPAAWMEAARAEAGRVSPELQAAIWLYVDDLGRSHTISQGIDTATGAYWHGIMHRREGDFSNAKYWFRNAGNHPAIALIGYDPVAFVDECSRRWRENPAELVELQRKEWRTLFDWCAQGEEK